jgi:UDP-2,4-diacetamido-2,4,6-trideoxy-beta-L-altropyranose hydrolase
MNTIYFRVDASIEQGEGHLRRCLTIAKSLTFNVKIVFLCSKLTPATETLLAKNNFCTIQLATDEYSQIQQVIKLIKVTLTPPLLIIDNYQISKDWEQQVKLATDSRIVVIDDLANRAHHCDLLIDANYFRKSEDYHSLVNDECEILCGIDYAIFSEQVLQSKSNLQYGKIKKNKNTTHLFFGATDPHANSAAIALQLAKTHQQKVFVALTQSTSQLINQQSQLSTNTDITVNTEEDTFSEVMSHCEFAIGAPGITLWERLILGCKTACFATSENQVAILQHLHQERICCYLGPIWEMNAQETESAIEQFYTENVHLLNLESIKEKFNKIGCQLVIDKIMTFIPVLQKMNLANISLIPYSSEHTHQTVNWLSSSQLRSTFGFSKEISVESHTLWLKQQSNFYLWAIINNKQYVGNISLKISPEKQTGYLEIYLGESHMKGQGIGKKSMAMIIEWSFNVMKLKQIELITIEGNLIAENLYKSSGFVLAYIKKKCQIIDGSYVNHKQWLLLNKQQD